MESSKRNRNLGYRGTTNLLAPRPRHTLIRWCGTNVCYLPHTKRGFNRHDAKRRIDATVIDITLIRQIAQLSRWTKFSCLLRGTSLQETLMVASAGNLECEKATCF